MIEPTTALAVHVPLTSLVAGYDQAVADVRRAYAILAGVEVATEMRVEGRHRERIDWSDPDSSIAWLRRSMWRTIVDRLELRRALSIAAAKKLDAHLNEELRDDDDNVVPLPEVTVENVEGFARHYRARFGEMVAEAVCEVHDWLRPHEHTRMFDYKTNARLDIGPRVVLTYMVQGAWTGGGFRVDYDRQKNLTALENVFNALDGRGQQTKTHYSALSNALEASPDGRGETELFRFRACKNRNLHLEFKRLDLLKRLNEVAGGARLKPHETGEAGIVVARCSVSADVGQRLADAAAKFIRFRAGDGRFTNLCAGELGKPLDPRRLAATFDHEWAHWDQIARWARLPAPSYNDEQAARAELRRRAGVSP